MRHLWAILLLSCSAFGATHFVRCDVANNGDGTTLTPAASPGLAGAFKDLPASLTRNDTYAVGGGNGTGNPCGAHTFNDVDSGTQVITIRQVSSALDSGIAGYASTMATLPVRWEDAYIANPQTNANPIWTFCRSYYTLQGGFANTDPNNSGGGASSFGFQVMSGNAAHSFGLIAGGSGCASSDNPITNISASNLFWGLDSAADANVPYYGSIVNCAYAGGVMTLTTADSSNFALPASVTIDGFSNLNAIVFQTQSATVAGSSLTVTTATNYCAASPSVYWVSLHGSLSWGIRFVLGDTSFQNINFSNFGVQYTAEHVVVYNCNSCTFNNYYVANNRTTPTFHGSPFQIDESQNATVSGPLTISNGFVLNPMGTGVWTHLGQSVACTTNCGTITGLNVFGNIVKCDTTSFLKCNVNYSVTDNSGATNINNLFFANNTMADMNEVDGTGSNQNSIGGKGGVQLGKVGGGITSGNVAYNNICWNIGYNCFYQASGNATLTHDYNLLLNSGFKGSGGGVLQAHELRTASGTTNPFVNSAANNYELTTDVGAIPTGCSLGTNCFRDGTSTHATLPANDVDYYGTSRGTPWDIGALQFVPAVANYPVTASPSGNATGTIVGSAGSTMNCSWNGTVASGTCSESLTAGSSATYTGTATSGSMTSFGIGVCVTSPCTVTVNSPLTVTATFQATVTCTLTLAANSLNSPTTVSATTALAGLSGPNSFWFVNDPLSANISLCSYPYGNCAAAGQSGNLPYTVSGLYSLGACSNGVCCAGSTAPLNINTGAGSAAH